MATLQSDSQGFLIGDVVTDIRRATDHLSGIRADVAAIKRAVLSAPLNRINTDNPGTPSGGSNARPSRERIRDSSAQNSRIATPNSRPRDASGRFLGGRITENAQSGSTEVRGDSGSLSALSEALPGSGEIATPNGRPRDASGRFTGNGAAGDGAPNDDSDDKKQEKKQSSLFSGFSDRIVTAITESAAGAEDADPTIKAFQEVAQPLARGYQILSGTGGDKKERWFKKIFKELNLFRKAETVFNQAANRSLHNIENNPAGSEGSGSSGVFAALLMVLGNLLLKIPILGTAITGITAVLSKIPLLRNLLPGVATGAAGIGSTMLRAGKGLFKKIPFLGALIGGAGAASDIYDTENDDSLTRGEKDRRDGKSAGGVAGSIGGMMAGAKLGAMAGALAGPLGAAIGGVVGGAAGMFFGDQAGQIIGEQLGEWVTELRGADIPGKIVEAWNTTADAIKNGWDGALKLMSSAWDKTKEAANAANDFVKDKTGVDVKAEVKNAYDSAVKYTADNIIPSLADLTNKGADKLKQGAEWVGENTTVGKGAKAAWNGAKSVASEIKARATGKFDPVKAALEFDGGSNITGLSEAQTKALAADTQRTESGGNQRAENKYGYIGKYQFGGEALAESGLIDKGALASAKKQSGKNWFKGGQTAFLNDNKNWKIEGGKEAYLSNASIQDKAFVDYTNKNAAGGIRSGAISASDSPEKIAAYVKSAHLKGVGGANKLFLGGNDSADANGTSAAKYAKDGAVAMGDLTRQIEVVLSKPSLPTQTASSTSPRLPTFAAPPAIADAPPLIQPLSGQGADRNITVSLPQGDVGQDVSDRGIAHIATGGLSGRG